MSRKSSKNDCINAHITDPIDSLINTARSLCDPDNKHWCELCYRTFIEKKGTESSISAPSFNNDFELEIVELEKTP